VSSLNWGYYDRWRTYIKTGFFWAVLKSKTPEKQQHTIVCIDRELGLYRHTLDGNSQPPLSISDTIAPSSTQTIVTGMVPNMGGNYNDMYYSMLYVAQDVSYPQLKIVNFFTNRDLDSVATSR
jgi:hypothetical protein